MELRAYDPAAAADRFLNETDSARPAAGTRRRGRPADRPRRRSRSVTSPVTITWSPAAITSRRSQATQTRASSIAGRPSRSLQATPGPLLGHRRLGGEGAGDRLLARVQDADPEAVGGLDGEQGAGAAVEAGEHQHRLDRERADGVGGRPGRALGAAGGDDRDAGRAGFAIAARKLAGSGGGIVGRSGSSPDNMIRAACVQLLLIAMVVAAALGLAACGFGEEGIAVSKDDPNYNGAVLFATHCSGCHTLSAAGTQGTRQPRRAHPGPEPQPANRDLRRRALRDPERRLLRGDHAPEHRRRQGGRRGRANSSPSTRAAKPRNPRPGPARRSP